MVKILFICHGNICRSPMAEFIMKATVREAGLTSVIQIDSAAVSREEIGNPIYPPAQRQLRAHGVPFDDHRARQMTRADYDTYDLLIGMDGSNLAAMRRICGGDPDGKLRLLMAYTGTARDVADPWYTGDFDAAWRDIESGCRALLDALRSSLGAKIPAAAAAGICVSYLLLRLLWGFLLGGEFCSALFAGVFDQHDYNDDDHGQQNQRGQRGGQTQNDILHAAGEARPAVGQGIRQLLAECASNWDSRRVDLDLAQIEFHGRIPDLHIIVAQAALNGLDLIAHVGQPLLKRDERLHVLALREHIE